MNQRAKCCVYGGTRLPMFLMDRGVTAADTGAAPVEACCIGRLFLVASTRSVAHTRVILWKLHGKPRILRTPLEQPSPSSDSPPSHAALSCACPACVVLLSPSGSGCHCAKPLPVWCGLGVEVFAWSAAGRLEATLQPWHSMICTLTVGSLARSSWKNTRSGFRDVDCRT